MVDTVISATNIGKRYGLVTRANRRGDLTLRDRLTQQAQALTQKIIRRPDRMLATPEDFWALKDISFEVGRGEIVGFVGRNGAGKSTLLKILSRITEPTTGRIEIEGRVASLLEVGTGFHGDLTGRENIYLNGAILGMSRADINRKFDEIVAFAEVEKFLDTPVKRYSSGMYVRLAFAVAAHLEPDILIVDEVLAVGDTAFQKKCLGKMGDVSSQEGRTVLFVSHNMETVQALCNRACLLEAGQIVGQGSPEDVISQYLQSMQALMDPDTSSVEHRQDRRGDGSTRIVSLDIEDADGHGVIRADSRLKITIGYRGEQPIAYPQFSATIFDYNKNVGLFTIYSEMMGGLPDTLPAEGKVTCITEPLYLTPGRCYINLSIYKAGGRIRTDNLKYAAYFDIERTDIFGRGIVPERKRVMCLRKYEWFVGEGSDNHIVKALNGTVSSEW
ncbi:MAG: ABC transporter ATP-binding protein [Cyanobacteria bacterium P01_F01_bin.4]